MVNEPEQPPSSEPPGSDMPRSAANRVTMVLALTAAILAFSAAAIQAATKHRLEIAPIAGGVLMLMLALQARSRTNSKR